MANFNKLIPNKTWRKRLFWIWFLLILVLALLPSATAPKFEIGKLEIDVRLDYIAHIGLYFGLTFLFAIWKFGELINIAKPRLYLYLVVGMLYALFTESIHLFLPKRGFNPIDISMNFLGLVFGTWFFIILIRYWKEKEFLRKLFQID